GPANSWGIHGLWPDDCDGDYSEDCDTSREYTDITTLIEKYGTTELLDFMETYWNSNDESNEDFWESEWAEHGTCISTLDPTCYTDYETGIEAVDFFQIVVNLFQTLTLYAAGIVPSNSATYTLSEINAAISAQFGQDPVLLCDDDTISEIYYGFYVNGPLLNQDFVPAAVVGEDSTCPSSGIKYPVKSGATTTTTTATATTTSSSSSATGSTVSGDGYWYAYYDGEKNGCLISEGYWYTTGTCATYEATTSGDGFTMTSSKGTCGVSDNELGCASGVSSTTFTVIDGYLAYDGTTTFYSNEIPTGDDEAYIWTDYGDYEVTFQWYAL
ncbi:ribonuclease T2, partial [Cryphonectria parasitica EP155]